MKSIPIGGVANPSLNGGSDLVPIDDPRVVIGYQAAKAGHVPADEFAVFGEQTPAEECDAILDAMDAGLTRMQLEPQARQELFDALFAHGENGLIPAEQEKVIHVSHVASR